MSTKMHTKLFFALGLCLMPVSCFGLDNALEVIDQAVYDDANDRGRQDHLVFWTETILPALESDPAAKNVVREIDDKLRGFYNYATRNQEDKNYHYELLNYSIIRGVIEPLLKKLDQSSNDSYKRGKIVDLFRIVDSLKTDMGKNILGIERQQSLYDAPISLMAARDTIMKELPAISQKLMRESRASI